MEVVFEFPHTRLTTFATRVSIEGLRTQFGLEFNPIELAIVKFLQKSFESQLNFLDSKYKGLIQVDNTIFDGCYITNVEYNNNDTVHISFSADRIL